MNPVEKSVKINKCSNQKRRREFNTVNKHMIEHMAVSNKSAGMSLCVWMAPPVAWIGKNYEVRKYETPERMWKNSGWRE